MKQKSKVTKNVEKCKLKDCGAFKALLEIFTKDPCGECKKRDLYADWKEKK
jgi:hypothetical protein